MMQNPKFGSMIMYNTLNLYTQVPCQLLQHEYPMVPHLSLPCVDVRDSALAHIRAMTSPQAAGHRHIVFTENLWMTEVAQVLNM